MRGMAHNGMHKARGRRKEDFPMPAERALALRWSLFRFFLSLALWWVAYGRARTTNGLQMESALRVSQSGYLVHFKFGDKMGFVIRI